MQYKSTDRWPGRRRSQRWWLIVSGLVLLGLFLMIVLLKALFLGFTSTSPGGQLFPDEWVKRQQEARQESFTFYGQVVDAAGQPIEGALVTLSLHTIDAEDRKEEHQRVTDQQGMFEFSDRGSTFGVVAIDGPGTFLHDKFGENSGFQVNRQGNVKTYLPDPNRPAVFVVVNKGDLIQTWPSRGGQDTYLNTGKIWANHPERPKNPTVEIIDTPEGPIVGEPIVPWGRYPGRD